MSLRMKFRLDKVMKFNFQPRAIARLSPTDEEVFVDISIL